MIYYTYVIYSDSFQRFYKGHCQHLASRIRDHNSGKTKSIRPFIPFRLVYYEVFDTRKEAMIREKYFKTAAGRRYLKKKISV